MGLASLFPSMKIVLAIVLIGLLTGSAAGWRITAWFYQKDLADLHLSQEKQVTKAQAATIAQERHAADKSRTVETDYETSLVDLRGRYDAFFDELRGRPAAGADLPAPSGRAGQHSDAGGADRLSRRSQEEVVLLMRAADEQTQRLIACQNWIKVQGMGGQ